MGLMKATNCEILHYITFLPVIYCLSLTYPNHFLPMPLHQIRQNDYLLKVLTLKDSRSASEGGVFDFQTILR